jgi:hypothetical protein
MHIDWFILTLLALIGVSFWTGWYWGRGRP